MSEHFKGWVEPKDSVEDFIDGAVNAFFENLDELVRLTPDEKSDVQMLVRRHIVNALLRKIKPQEDVAEVKPLGDAEMGAGELLLTGKARICECGIVTAKLSPGCDHVKGVTGGVLKNKHS